ncbi:hypothetical protein RhiirA5_421418 [Rhizophagus irregularis]|uniref:Uncharacterized protein n=1 Tax=Rhizophagus irregularis TaxID=588596 RepID=A0A2N0S6F6_9GLOM|nr:hypothetical protein RhiirA5_421418 [Rhizophagus irregularis]PKC71145.1 hypothetical protein RhiirA1_453874 [Rhizophagus irregularis]CAG8640703.1 15353_t:CDS:2 [Rhizophagus irregularis]
MYPNHRYTNYKQSLHKKISPLSQSLGTAVDVHRNDLFVNRFPVTEHDDNSLAEANEDTKIDCVPSNTSLHGPLRFTVLRTLRVLAVITPTSFSKENPLQGEKILSSNNQDLSVISTSSSSFTGDTSSGGGEMVKKFHNR